MKLIYSKELKFGLYQVWNDRPEFSFVEVKQIHGVHLSTPEDTPCEADGIIIENINYHQALCIKTADCLPIFIQGKKGSSFIHAGWRGLADGILKNENLKKIEPIFAFIGPSIQSCCFEVTNEFQHHFKEKSHFIKKNNQLFFDLIKEAMFQMQNYLNISDLENSGICTCCNEAFNSYRRNKTKQRNYNIFRKDHLNG